MKAPGLIRDKTIYMFLQHIGLVGGDEPDVSQNFAHVEAIALVRNFVVRFRSECSSLSRALGKAKYNNLGLSATLCQRVCCNSPISLRALRYIELWRNITIATRAGDSAVTR